MLTIRGNYSPLFTITWLLKHGDFPLYMAKTPEGTMFAFDQAIYEEYARNAFQNYLRDSFDLSKFKELFNYYVREIDTVYQEYIQKDIASIEENDLCEIIQRTQNLFDNLVSDSVFIEFLSPKIIREVLDSEGYTDVSIDTIIAKVDEVRFDSFAPRHAKLKQRELKKTKGVISPELINKVKYLYTDYIHTKPAEYIQKDLETIQIEEESEENNNGDHVLSSLSEKERQVFEYCEYIFHLRDLRKDDMAKVQALFQIFAFEMAHRADIDESHSFAIAPTELIKGSAYLRQNKEDILERLKGCESYSLNNDLVHIHACSIDIDAIEADLNRSSLNNQNELKGDIACKGFVTSKVRVVLDATKNTEFKEGEILVTSMTRPEFLSLMKKAAAVITNEGGITCHAAIVSRELNKPCIIGTKIATQVLKDGDEIEVDANRGVIRILRHKTEIKPLLKEDINITEWEFEAQQRGEQPILLCDFFSRSLTSLIRDMTGRDEHYAYLFTDSDKLNHSPRHRDIVIKTLRENIYDHEKRSRYLKDSIEVPKSFNKVADEVEAKIAKPITNQELAELWRAMDRDFLKVIPWFYYPWYISKENMLTDPVKEGLEKYRSEIEKICDLDEALLAIVFPIKRTNFQLEQDEMLGLVQIAEKIVKKNDDFVHDEKFKEAAAKYLKKYDYLTTFILTPILPMTYEQLVERVRRNVEESFADTYALQMHASRKNEKRAKEILTVIKNDTELMRWVSDAQELGYVLTAGVEEAYMASARYMKFMQIVAERIGVTFEDSKYLLSREISSALEEDRKIPSETIEERRKGFVIMIKENEQYATFGKAGHELSAWIDGELNRVDTSITEFNGQRACKGFARGKVRIATTPTQAHELLEGEILVCPMTNPDYVPAMRRSAAIVTDEGGLLSHAAIMSREFGKPCVIGTKIATQLLKTGDMIEVDADTGTIRILPIIEIIEFKKSYSRDTTLFLQELWAKGLVERSENKFGWKNPCLPIVAHYVTEGVVEIWEHIEGIAWLSDRLLAENLKGTEFLERIFDEYVGLLQRLKTFHQQDVLTDENIDEYIDLVYNAAYDMTLFFYTGGDERSPKEAQAISVRAREAGDFFAENDAFVRRHIAREANISEEMAGVVLAEEFKNPPSKEILTKRLKEFLIIDGEKKWTGHLRSFMQRESQYRFREEKVDDNVQEIKGQSAYKGIVRGAIQIVRKQSDMAKVQQGDILVAPMTTPDFLPAMLKAAAFVTDEGGITCHAAIVAREMKKPCIIGTKIATQVFKDGDLVEVDAENGIVRILG